MFDFLQPKAQPQKAAPPPPPKQAAPQPAATAAHGVAANHLLNKSATMGDSGSLEDHAKLQQAPKSDGGVVKHALGDLFSGFASTAKNIAGSFKQAGTSIKNALFGDKESAEAAGGASGFDSAKTKEGVATAQATAPGETGGGGLFGKIGAGLKGAFGGLLGGASNVLGGIGGLFGGKKEEAKDSGPVRQFGAAQGYDLPALPKKMEVLDPSVPSQAASADEKNTQQYTQTGLPMTPEAWKMQNTIDGGKLYDVYKQMEAQVKAGKLPKEQLEQAAIDNYIKMANETKGSSFILEVMPTEMQWSTGGAVDKAGGNTGIGDYRVGGDVAQTRRIAESVSDTIAKKSGQNPDSADPEQIKKAKAQVFALMVPYNNGAENIAAHDAKPMDAVENLHNMLGKLDKNVNTVATGYSQGGGAVLEYAHKYGGQDGLDKIIALAPMGGADRFGADGVYSGNIKGQDNRSWWDKLNPFSKKQDDPGVDTLSIMNAADPAKNIYDPLKDNPMARGARNGLVNQIPNMVSGGIDAVGKVGSMIPGIGPLIGAGANLAGGLWDGATKLLGNEKVQDGLAQLGSNWMGGKANQEMAAAQQMPQNTPEQIKAREEAIEKAQNNQQMAAGLPAMMDMLQRDGTQAGDVLALAPAMANFIGGGSLNNQVKNGLGWVGEKASQIAPWAGAIGGAINPLLGLGLGTGLGSFGNWAQNTADGMHVQNQRPDGCFADVHGAPADGRYDLGTYGYGMSHALPLLDTFLGGPSVTPQNAEVAGLQQQIAANQGQEYGRRGDWEFIRQPDSAKDPQTQVCTAP